MSSFAQLQPRGPRTSSPVSTPTVTRVSHPVRQASSLSSQKQVKHPRPPHYSIAHIPISHHSDTMTSSQPIQQWSTGEHQQINLVPAQVARPVFSPPTQQAPVIQMVKVKHPVTQQDVELEDLNNTELEDLLKATSNNTDFLNILSEFKNRQKATKKKGKKEYKKAKKKIGKINKKLEKGSLEAKKQERLEKKLEEKEDFVEEVDKQNESKEKRLRYLRDNLRDAGILSKNEDFYAFDEPVRRHWIRRVTFDDLSGTGRPITTVSGDNLSVYTEQINGGDFYDSKQQRETVSIKTNDGRVFGSSHKKDRYPVLYPVSGPTCSNLGHNALEAMIRIRDNKGVVNGFVTKNYSASDIKEAEASLKKAGL